MIKIAYQPLDPSAKHELDISYIDGHILVKSKRQGHSILICTVYPPTLVERILGITFEKKLKKAVKKARLKINKLNDENKHVKS